jgi:hypothetical protein
MGNRQNLPHSQLTENKRKNKTEHLQKKVISHFYRKKFARPFQKVKLAKIDPIAVDKTLTSFESGTGDIQIPVIRNLPDVLKPPDPLEESIKQLEISNKKLQENMEHQNRAAADAMASLDLIAKRVQKRKEMRDILLKFKALKAELTEDKSSDALKALRAKEVDLTAEMNQTREEYEVLDSEFKKFKPTDTPPVSK